MTRLSVSRVLSKPRGLRASHLSSRSVAATIKRFYNDYLAGSQRIYPRLIVSLQRTGFTFLQCHHYQLRALAPLVSPLP